MSWELAARIARALALAVAAAAALLVGYIVVRRIGYPYDLEWMEGGMLCHALRLALHQPIYAPPSVDFIPYLYTPLYPVVLFILGKVFGLGYFFARLLSVASFGGAIWLGYRFATQGGGSRVAAAVAMTLPIAAFAPTGAFYDLARPDSLALLLGAAGLFVGWWKRRSHLHVALAAALLVAGFFAKQTGAPLMIALGLALLVTNWRVVPTYVATLALLGLPALWLVNRSSDGWFWTYVYKMHQSHDFYRAAAFLGTPERLLLLLGPGLALVPWALARRLAARATTDQPPQAADPTMEFAAFIACVGIGMSCVSFGTRWAFVNAFIPGVYFPSVAIARAAAELLRGAGPRRQMVVYALLAATVAIAPGALHRVVVKWEPRDWRMNGEAPIGYDPRPLIPTAADRRAGDALLARIRATDGDVLIPFHPFYAHLAGKPTHLHRMGVWDIYFGGLGTPRGLAEAIAREQFDLAVIDNKMDGNWWMWPGLQTHYKIVERIRGPHVVTGAPTEPTYLMTPAGRSVNTPHDRDRP